MRLIYKPGGFIWFESRAICDEQGSEVITAKGQPEWGHRIALFSADGEKMGTVREKSSSPMLSFELYLGEVFFGRLKRGFSFSKPKYHIDPIGWRAEGNFVACDYRIYDAAGDVIAAVKADAPAAADKRVIEIYRTDDVVCSLLAVLSIDAERRERA